MKEEVQIEKEVERELSREYVAADSDESDEEMEEGDIVESEEDIEV